MSSHSINKFCPRSGQRVQPDSLTTYRGQTVGFCNPDCCKEFASNPTNYPSDRFYFDALIKEFELPSIDTTK